MMDNIDIPSNPVTLQFGISNRHSRTKGSIINGNVYKGTKKELKKPRLMVILSVIVIFISLFALIFSYINQKNRPVFVKEYDVYFRVEEGRAGFDINNTILTFGIIPRGGGGTRKIDIENKFDFPINAKFFISENLAGYSNFPGDIILEIGEKKVIEVNMNVPKDAEEKNYTGKFRMEFYKIKR